MSGRFSAGLWFASLILGAAAVIFGSTPEPAPWLGLIAALLLISAAGQFIPSARRLIGAPARWVRRSGVRFWFTLLIYLAVVIGHWVAFYQPTNGWGISGVEYALLLCGMWGLLYLIGFDAEREQFMAIGRQLSKSKWSGVLVTLTTLMLLFWGAEAYLRLFYITTDGFSFTAMNYYWYRNFGWAQENSLGYRDHEPQPDREGLTRVAIVGDSFAMGHGINDLDASFPQILERELGENYDVNLIARSGWDTDVQMYNLDQYPYRPDVVVLSYYLNDIDHLLTAPEEDPNNRFDFPENPTLSWFILNYFTPNYVYYNLLQFTSPVRTRNFFDDLVNAHLDDEKWSRQAQLLYEIVLWTRDHDAELIALLWPNIIGVDASRPALDRLNAFFAEQGVTVVDMSAPILANAGNPALIVNSFDTHPGPLSQQLAADGLYQAIIALQQEAS